MTTGCLTFSLLKELGSAVWVSDNTQRLEPSYFVSFGFYVSPYITIVHIIFHFLWGHLGPLWCIRRWSSANTYARGRKQCCKLHYCLWRVSIKPRLSFSNRQCVLCFQRQSFYVYFASFSKKLSFVSRRYLDVTGSSMLILELCLT